MFYQIQDDPEGFTIYNHRRRALGGSSLILAYEKNFYRYFYQLPNTLLLIVV